ncbi:MULTISPECIES: AAA family ATPase [Flavobacterium]|uniref:AAA family ATPase n=1 Tax=Flavobacterium hankyongi TaxID=1176532 RepID=A0ABP8ZT32_9FLAO|nr:AAA family ATPase [Flavobacterium sp. N1846]
MQIKHIHIKNFRGFEDKSFTFKERFTVAIGNNGLGKSTLLNALQVGLGAFLQSMPTLPANYIYRRQFKKGERFVKYHADRKDYLPNKENPSITVTSSCYNSNLFDEISETISWHREYLLSNSTTHKKEHSVDIIHYANYLFDNHDKNSDILYPVLANFHINRTNAQVRRVDKKWRRMSRLEKGYYTALGESVDFTGVYEWLYSYEKKVRDDVEFEGTIQAMYLAITTAIPYIKEIEYNSKYDEFEVLVDFKDGQPIERKIASMLSDGMKAMLYMVAEIAYRCVMLNGKLGFDAIKNSPGIVLIDELDMHLHPTWQRHVINDLKTAFPKIQFVVTTHSPFIVQSINADELINLDVLTTINPKDYSIEIISEEVMNVDGSYGTEKNEEESQSLEYFQLLAEAEKSSNKDVYKMKLEQLENSITDTGLRAYLKTHRIAKNII